jgi:hypothetical protein
MKWIWILCSLLPQVLSAQHPSSDSSCPGGDDFIIPREAAWGDVVFSEVMYDPDPPVGLFIGEYLELYNRSDDTIPLEGWQVKAGERVHVLNGRLTTTRQDLVLGADQDLRLAPGQYAVVTGITLPNQGATLALYSPEGVRVHAASYRVPYDGPEWKKEGGWSLESPDPDMVCNAYRLWQFSMDPSGGSPGRLNSVDTELEDHEPPLFLWLGFGDSSTVCLQYSEPLQIAADIAGGITIGPGRLPATKVTGSEPLSDQLVCIFPVDLFQMGEFRIRVPGVSDCSGNPARDMALLTGRGAPPSPGSVLISEIMYDPAEGAPEYIELFNPGPGFIDLKDLSLDVAGEGEVPEQFRALCSRSRIMAPGHYVVITRNTLHLMDAYGLELSGSWLEMDEFESLPNSGGAVYLAGRAGNIVDAAVYGDRIHMDLIGDTRGVSLERIRWDRPGSDPGNWHSAASIEGYCTPGRENSQSAPEGAFQELLLLEPGVFSPDNDGYHDLLTIQLAPGERGNVVRLWVTDMSGNTIRVLANSHITGPVALYTWDGEQDNGQMAAEGLYVVHVRGYHPASGRRWSDRAATAIIYP